MHAMQISMGTYWGVGGQAAQTKQPTAAVAPAISTASSRRFMAGPGPGTGAAQR
jgi:hypothetical protein